MADSAGGSVVPRPSVDTHEVSTVESSPEPVAAAAVAAAAAAAATGPDLLGSFESFDSDSSDSESPADANMKLLHLLCTLAEDVSRRNGIVHRGTTCNSCRETPIRGVRYKCAQCADVDLCSACEAHDLHAQHMLLKINVPLPPLVSARTPLVRRMFPGVLVPRDLDRSVRKRLEDATHLDRADLSSLYGEFCVLASAEHGTDVITRDTFYRCLGQFGGAQSVLGARLFAFYDADGDGALTFEEMACGFSVYTKGSLDEKAPAVFRAYDVDGDDRVGRDDLRTMLEAFADTNRELTKNMVEARREDVAARLEVLESVRDHTALLPITDALPAVAGSESLALSASVDAPSRLELALAPTFWHDRAEDDGCAVMEALGHDAVAMMVDEIFAEAVPEDPDFMTYAEFLAHLRRNSSLAIYLEVLGTIF
ncbi:hypothetical protein BX661DRAFT_206025 [Kickxella alabastrina]|uniref:uncharacterized protein n=1 Tax=Kickxella alabastrina TaxID=61397 RepID=UPI002220F5F0|nr:uncharacterized protein BX661DRAFT_206025 [Kickxella alabastrina]KAI7826444.1 hypothetical protein BX661DRAFT_206025 [Kickxella alabastrina]